MKQLLPLWLRLSVSAAVWIMPLFLLMCSHQLNAQDTLVIGPISGTADPRYGPYITHTSGTNQYKTRNAYLYEASELNIPPNSIITSVSWLKANNNTISGNNKFELWAGNTDLTTLGTAARTSASLKEEHGLVQIYASESRSMLAETGEYEEFPASEIFFYRGGGLLLLTDWEDNGTSTGPNTFYVQSKPGMALGIRILKTAIIDDATSLTTSYGGSRPTIRITWTRPEVNAGVSALVTPESDFLCATQTVQEIRVEVTNYGSRVLNSVRVNMQIGTAAPSFVDVTTPIDTLGSAAGNKMVVSMGNLNLANNVQQLRIWTSNPSGGQDNYPQDDTLNAVISAKSLKGTYIVGSGAGADYATIQDAVEYLQQFGICDSVLFLVRDGIYSQVTIDRPIVGVGPDKTITFRAESGNAENVVISHNATAATNNWVVSLNGASYIRFNKLTFQPLNISASWQRGVVMENGAHHIAIEDCRFISPGGTNNTINHSLLFASNSGTGNRFSNNLFRGGAYAISYTGQASIRSDSTVFENNSIENARIYGAHLSFTDNLRFSDNVMATNSTTSNQHGLHLENVLGALQVSGNRITGMLNGYGIRILAANGSASMKGQVFNNVVSFGGNAAACYGIYCQSSSYLRIYNNSVRITGTASANANNVYAGYFSFTTNSHSDNEILNNVFANTGGGRSFFFQSTATANNVSDYNNLYTSGTILAAGGTAPAPTYADLKQLRASALSTDQNSVSYYPGFTGALDLRPSVSDSASWSLNGRGIHIPGNSTDALGNPRSVNPADGVPDIGAYEFVPSSLPPRAVSSISGTVEVFSFGEDTVAVIEWGSTAPVPLTVRQFTGTLPVNAMDDRMYFYTDIADASGSYNYTGSIYYKDPWLGNLGLESNLRLAEYTGASWSVYSGTASNVDTLRNTLSRTGLSQFSSYTGGVAKCSGTPAAAPIITPPAVYSVCEGSVVSLLAQKHASAEGLDDILYQWEDSTDGGSWAAVSGGDGAATLAYTTYPLPESVWFRLRTTCGSSGHSVTGDAYFVPVTKKGAIVNLAPAGRCGPGTVTLSATASPGASVFWFSEQSGGARIGSGQTHVTPVLSADSVFYVSANADVGISLNAGLEARVGTSNIATANMGLVFDAYEPFILDSLAVYPVGNGTQSTITVALYRTDDGSLLQQTVVPVTGSAAPGVKTMIPLDFYVPSGIAHRLVLTARGNTAAIASLGYENSVANSGFPHQLDGVLAIRGGTSTAVHTNAGINTNYYYFYDWKISAVCEGQRIAVPVSVHSLPVVSVSAGTAPQPFCSGADSMELRATPVMAGSSFQWAINGVEIPGGTDTLFKATRPGSYTVLATDPLNCTGVSPALRVTPALSGDYTVGGADPDFTTLADAVTYLHTHGVCGPVHFLLRSGTYSGQTVINNSIPGLSALNSVTFSSEAGDRDSVIIRYTATTPTTNYVWRLEGVSYITLRHLTLRSEGASYRRVLEVTGSASYNTVDSCVLESPAATGQTNLNVLLYASAWTGTRNRFSYNVFRNGSYGIYYEGTSQAVPASGSIFEYNRIENAFSNSAYFRYVNELVFRGNTVSTNTSYATHIGVYLGYTNLGLEVSGNRIHDMISGDAINLDNVMATASAPGLIANNEISIGSNANAVRGIYAYRTSYLRFYNNSVHITGTSATGDAGHFNFNGTAYVNNEVYNNVFANSGGGRALLLVSSVGNGNLCDYNNLYGTGPVLVRGGVSAVNYDGLTAWRANTLQLDGNSISYRPGFTSSADLRPDPADSAAWSLNGRGTHLAGNEADIDGKPRSTTPGTGVPDIGAYEFEPQSEPPLAVAVPPVPRQDSMQVFTFGEDTVARVFWDRYAPVPADVAVRVYSGRMAPQHELGDTMYFHTSIAADPGLYNYTLDIYYKDPWLGTVTSEADVRFAKRRNGSYYWDLYEGARSTVDTDRNMLTAEAQSGAFPKLFTGSRLTPCTGQPLAGVVATDPLTAAICERDSLLLISTNPNPYSGIRYQWQQASQQGGPWSDVTGRPSAVTPEFNTGSINNDVFYRVNLTCAHSGLSASGEDAYEVRVIDPGMIGSTVPAAHCGPGSVTLRAFPVSDGTLRWYGVPQGGNLLDTGEAFVTPPLFRSTTFYVAVSLGLCESVRLPVTADISSLPVGSVYAARTHLCAGDSTELFVSPGYSYQWLRNDEVIRAATGTSYTARDSGAYSIVITDGDCIDTSRQIPVIVYPAPNPSVSSSNGSLLAEPGYVLYQWSRDGELLPGASDRRYTPDSSGIYTVFATDLNGCTGESEEYAVRLGITQRAGLSGHVKLYPNPTTGMVYIDAQASVAVVISSMDGKVIFRAAGVREVDISSLASGMYMMHVHDGNGLLLTAERITKVN